MKKSWFNFDEKVYSDSSLEKDNIEMERLLLYDINKYKNDLIKKFNHDENIIIIIENASQWLIHINNMEKYSEDYVEIRANNKNEYTSTSSNSRKKSNSREKSIRLKFHNEREEEISLRDKILDQILSFENENENCDLLKIIKSFDKKTIPKNKSKKKPKKKPKKPKKPKKTQKGQKRTQVLPVVMK